MFQRARVTIWCSLSGIAGLLMAVMIPAPATAYSCGTAGNYHDGYYTTPTSTSMTNLYGVRMVAEVLKPKFCSGGNSSNFSNVYDMSYSNPNYSVHGWSQVGYERGISGGPHPGLRDFAQVANGPYLDTWYSAGKLSTGTTRKYKVRDVNTAPLLNTTINYVNGSAVLMGGTGYWVSPFYIEISAEARYKGNDVVGTSGNKADLTGLKYLNKSNDTYYDMPSGIFNKSTSGVSHWHHKSIGATHKTLWSDPTN